jgi:hypothetical protein
MVEQKRKSLAYKMLWRVDIARHLGTLHIVSHPLQSVIRSVLLILSTIWPHPDSSRTKRVHVNY